MSQVSRTTVKTYFNTGDTPTEAQFVNTLDSIKWYNEGIQYVDVQISDARFKTLLSSEGVAAQGTLTLAGQPTATNTFSIGSFPFIFIANGGTPADFEIEIGVDLATTKTNLVTAINAAKDGGFGFAYTISSFIGSNAVLTYAYRGALSESLTSTEPNLTFDGATIGSTRAGANAVRNDITVLPAPGAGLCYIFPTHSCVWLVVDTSNGAYTVPDEVSPPSVKWVFADNPIDPLFEDESQLTAGEVTRNFDDGALQGDWSDEDEGNDNMPLKIANLGPTNYGGGGTGNTISLRVFYMIAPSVPFGA